MTSAEILVFEDEQWVDKSAKIIQETVDDICKLKDSCSIMLTGGRSAEKIYREWSNSSFLEQNRITFYFGDERCVSHNDTQSSYHMVSKVLLTDSIHKDITIYPIYGDAIDKKKEANRYAALLPSKIDILLLSIGEDAHIASIFPYDRILMERQKKVVPVTGPKEPFSRISITPVVISSALRIFCFGQGATKGKALASVFNDTLDILSIPAKLALQGTWLIDHSANRAMKQFFK